MRVYHVSSANFLGGAARAGFRQHLALKRAGHDSVWLDPYTAPNQHNAIIQIPTPNRPILQRTLARLYRRYSEYATRTTKEFWSIPYGQGIPAAFKNLPPPDLWNLHWVGNYLDWKKTLNWMSQQAPIVWTLHDENPFIGIWHYENQNEQLPWKTKQLNTRVKNLKRRILREIPRDRIAFVGPSKWITDRCTLELQDLALSATHIPYGVDVETFCPMNQTTCREFFGVKSDRKVIGFIADSVSDPRKGFAYLMKAIQEIDDRMKITLLTVGRGAALPNNSDHINLGPIQNDRLLSAFYSACDVFVCPSLADNLPNTILESLSCGTPVAGFDSGGVPDLLHTKISGGTVPCRDYQKLANLIEKILFDKPEYACDRKDCRNLILNNYTYGINAARYSKLYESMIDNIYHQNTYIRKEACIS